jgi:flagellar motor switch protein FliM
MSAVGATSETGRDSLAELFTGASNFVERMPMLRVAFDRAAATCTEDLATTSDLPLQMTLQGLESGIAGDLLDKYDGRSVVGVLHASRWSARLLVNADRDAVFTIVEAMLGGDGSQPAYSIERAFSRIELRLAEAFFQRIAKALEGALTGIADTPINLESAGREIDYDVIGGRSSPAVLARLRVDAGVRGGEVLVTIPRAALNPLRQVLARVPAKDGPPADARWSEQIQSQVSRTHVTLSAILDERPGTLGEVAAFHVGKVVELNATTNSRVRLECNGERLVWCHLGKSQGKYTLRVEEFIDREQEFLDEILSS